MEEIIAEARNEFGPISALMEDPTIEEVWINDRQIVLAAPGTGSSDPLDRANGAFGGIHDKLLAALGARR